MIICKYNIIHCNNHDVCDYWVGQALTPKILGGGGGAQAPLAPPVPTPMLFKSQARDMEMITLMEACDGVFKLKDRELERNTEYSFHVVVTNSVGSVQSTPVQIGKY